MTDQESTVSLKSKVCPACEANKSPSYSFCGLCFYRLPIDMQQALYKKFFEGYLEAFRAIE